MQCETLNFYTCITIAVLLLSTIYIFKYFLNWISKLQKFKFRKFKFLIFNNITQRFEIFRNYTIIHWKELSIILFDTRNITSLILKKDNFPILNKIWSFVSKYSNIIFYSQNWRWNPECGQSPTWAYQSFRNPQTNTNTKWNVPKRDLKSRCSSCIYAC